MSHEEYLKGAALADKRGEEARMRDAQMNAAVNKAPGNYYNDCCGSSQAAPVSERFTLANIEDAMAYQPWGWAEQQAGDIVREALTAAAKAILRSVPDSPYRSVALRNVLDARMNANAAISFRGRF